MVRALAIALIALGVLGLLLSLAFAVIAYSGVLFQCPDGYDCADARAALVLGGGAASLSLVFLLAGWVLFRRNAFD